MGKTERKDGLYHVEYLGEWTVGKWSNKYYNGSWEFFGLIGHYSNRAVTEIGPRIPEYKPKKRKSQTP